MPMRIATPEDVTDERGIALIVTLMAMSLLLALGLALTLMTMTEVRIAAAYRRGVEARYAADAAVARAVLELSSEPRWDDVLGGLLRSAFADGSATGVRTVPGGGSLDLAAATSTVRCGKASCTQADLIAITADRPWGANNPVWQPYAYGPLKDFAPPGTLDSPTYVVVWVADDPGENDDDPLHDGGPSSDCDLEPASLCADRNAGRGVIVVLGRAFGPDDTQRTILVTLARPVLPSDEGEHQGAARVISWREWR